VYPIDAGTLRKAIAVILDGATWLDHEIAAALFHHIETPERTLAPNRLSPREREVLQLLMGGRTNEQIARAIGRSYPTVRTHLANLYRKLGVNDRVSAAVYAMREHLT
jgi:DNA-binding NarL/FixJ family response regulator